MGSSSTGRIIVVLLAAWVILSAIPHTVLAFSFGRGGTAPLIVPISTDYDGRFRQAWGSAAPEFQPGDKLAWENVGADTRYTVTPARPPVVLAGPVSVPLTNRPSPLVVRGEPYPFGAADLVLRAMATLALVAALAIIAFKNPSRRTWALYLFAIGANPIALNARLARYPSSGAWVAYVIIVDALTAVAFLAAADFAVTNAGESSARIAAVWRKSLPFVAGAFLAVEIWPDVGTIAFGQHLEILNRVGFVFQGVLVVFGAIVLAYAARTRSEIRVRIAPIAYLVAVGGNYAASVFLYSSFFRPAPDGVNDALQTLSLAVFFFVINGTVGWRVIRRQTRVRRSVLFLVSQSSAATVSEIVKKSVEGAAAGPHESALNTYGLLFISLLLGILIERGADQWSKRLIYRGRDKALEALETIANGFVSAKQRIQIEQSLVTDPTRLLELTAAVVLRRDAAGVFQRSQASGDAHVAADIPAGAAIIDAIAAAPNGTPLIAIPEGHGGNAAFLHGLGYPLTGAPLSAVALYGPHEWGEELDSEERAYLAMYVRSAAHAYENATAD
jgi:hypothetical protein